MDFFDPDGRMDILSVAIESLLGKAESARNGVRIKTRRADDSVISAAISATRVLPALVGKATTKSSLTSVERRAASRCDGHSSTSEVFRA